jgi:heptosyltransferase-2
VFRVGGKLRAERYDLIVDLQHKVRSSLLSYLASPQTRIVLRKRTLGKSLKEFTGISGPLCDLHTVDMYLRVLADVDIPPDGRTPEVHLDPQVGRAVVERINAARNGHKTLVGFNVGAGCATKRLPVGTVRAAAAALQKIGCGIVLTGARNDSGRIFEVASSLPESPVLTAHNFSLKELSAAIGAVDVLVSGDSGPVHIASALGTPTVTVYGPTSPRRWGPLSARHEVIWHEMPCAPCSNHGGPRCPKGPEVECMQSVKSDEIVAAATRLLP